MKQRKDEGKMRHESRQDNTAMMSSQDEHVSLPACRPRDHLTPRTCHGEGQIGESLPLEDGLHGE